VPAMKQWHEHPDGAVLGGLTAIFAKLLELDSKLTQTNAKLALIEGKENKLMALIDDLRAAFQAYDADVQILIQKLGNPGISAEDAKAEIDAVNTAKAALDNVLNPPAPSNG